MREPDGDSVEGNEHELNSNMRSTHDSGHVGENERSVQPTMKKTIEVM